MEHNTEEYTAGVDEVGRGCLFGPVVAAAVVLPLSFPDDKWKMIKDSKKLSEKRRKELSDYIKNTAICYSIKEASHKEIDDINILQASIRAMNRAIDDIYIKIDKDFMFSHIHIDGNKFDTCYMPPDDDDIIIPHTCHEKGDNKILGIAAASIIAKVYRDELIVKGCDDNEIWNLYDLKKNKGYGTAKHRAAIQKHGIIEGHRLTFKPCIS